MFTGASARVPLGARGLTGNLNPLAVDATSLLQAEGIKFDGQFISKEDGRKKYNEISLGSRIMSLYDWFATPSIQYLIAATADGRIMRDSGLASFSVTLKSGLTPGRVVHICEGGKEAAAQPKKLFFFNGVDPVQVVAGTSVTSANLATPPADWNGVNQPSFGIHHNGRIWGGGNDNDGHRLYYSDPGNHEAFTGSTSGSLSVYPGVGQKLIGGISFAGRLIVFKRPRGIFWVDDSALLQTDWRILNLSNGVGLASPWSLVVTEGTVLFQSPEGLIYDLSMVESTGGGTDTTGGMFPVPITDEEDLDVWLRRVIDPGLLHEAQMVYHSSKRTMFAGVAKMGASLGNDTVISVDAKKQPMKFAYSYNHQPSAFAIQRQPDGSQKLISGDNSGTVWIHDQVQKNVGGQPYMGRFQIAHTNFSWLDAKLADVRKRCKFLIVYYNPTGAHSLTVDILMDGFYTQSVHFPMGSVGGMLDSFVLGTDRLGGDLNTSRRKRIKGSAFQYSLIGYNAGLNEDFQVNEIVWQFVPSSRRERR